MTRSILFIVCSGLALGPAVLHGQIVEDFNPPRSNCCLAGTAKTLADQLQDWNQLGRYHAANEDLKKAPADAGRVVFLGDSITDNWKLDEYFPGKPYVNRGISGQTTPQMLVRMYPDVIDLKPAALVVFAGTNDIAHNTGPETLTMIQENIMAITELAQKHGIRVYLCSLTPISDYTLLPTPPGQAAQPGSTPAHRVQTVQRPPADILRLNAWLKQYATQNGATYVDYYSAVVDQQGMFREGLSNDGLHPNAAGYKLMAPVIAAALGSTQP